MYERRICFEDIDQTHSSAAVSMARQLCLETPEVFVSAMEKWLAKLERRFEKMRYVFKVDASRNWKVFLEQFGKKVKGIAGQGASHWFEFVRRSELVDDHKLRHDGHEKDIVLRWM